MFCANFQAVMARGVESQSYLRWGRCICSRETRSLYRSSNVDVGMRFFGEREGRVFGEDEERRQKNMVLAWSHSTLGIGGGHVWGNWDYCGHFQLH